jgi:hypothetical protein
MGKGTEARPQVDYETLIRNALIALYQPTKLRGEDFHKLVARLFDLTPREARVLLEDNGFDPFSRVLKSFKSYPYSRAEAATDVDE